MKDTEEKILCRSPFRSGRRSLVCARLTNKGKAGVQRGRETAGVPSSLSPPRTRQSPALRRAQLPTEPQRKTPHPSGANTPAAVRVPRSAGAEKTAARQGRTRLRQFVSPSRSVQEIHTKKSCCAMQQLFRLSILIEQGRNRSFLVDTREIGRAHV